jgi:RNA polymerase sigma factor (TIGR02999 family)
MLQGVLMLLAWHPATSRGLTPRCWPVTPAAVILDLLSHVTRILSAIEQGDPHAAEQLLPLVYDELRKLAAQRLAQEKPGQTLQATALVHEANPRLVDVEQAQRWSGRGHFFAAAEAVRRILVGQTRRKQSLKCGGGRLHVDLPAPEARSDDLVALDEALSRLERHNPDAARLVKLRYFAELSHQRATEASGGSRGAAVRLRALGRTWPFRQLSNSLTATVFFTQGRAAAPGRGMYSRPVPRAFTGRLLIAGGVIAPPGGGLLPGPLVRTTAPGQSLG